MITQEVLLGALNASKPTSRPPSEEPALTPLTCVGEEDRIIEVRGDNTADRRRIRSPRRTFKGWK